LEIVVKFLQGVLALVASSRALLPRANQTTWQVVAGEFVVEKAFVE
jgi:hypothetical protein